jgi:general secretion pathway protein G
MKNDKPIAVSRSSGFSLIEMIAVLVLIGLIAGIVAPRIANQLGGGRVRAAKAQLSSLSSKVEMFVLDVGSTPERLDDLLTRPGNAEGWNGPYAKEADLKDPWGQPFEYKAPGEHGEFDLMSYGADKKSGGDGNNKDLGNWE